MASKPTPERNDSMVSRTEEIAAVLKREILMGQYRPGERLPSERDLSKRFETSRGTVREALKKLEQLGIASIQLGGQKPTYSQSQSTHAIQASDRFHPGKCIQLHTSKPHPPAPTHELLRCPALRLPPHR